MAKIIWTEEAVRWMREIGDFIAVESPNAAQRVVAGIYDRIFRVWVYKIDESEYQLRQIEPVDYAQKEIDDLLKKYRRRLFRRSM